MAKLHDKLMEHLISVYTSLFQVDFDIAVVQFFDFQPTKLECMVVVHCVSGLLGIRMTCPFSILLLGTATMLPVFDASSTQSPPKLIGSQAVLIAASIFCIPRHTSIHRPSLKFLSNIQKWLNLVMPISSHGPTTNYHRSPVVLSKRWLFYESWICSS
jgi:hypothetical protein